MRHRTTTMKLLVIGLVMGAFALPAMALAQQGNEDQLSANLSALNGSGASGSAEVQIDGNQVTVTVTSSGVSASLPHAQHVHIGGQNQCPTDAADTDGDGLINTAEGQPAYGAVQISLTTEGDVGVDSALAVDRFPAANADGSYTYERTFELPSGVAMEDLQNGVVVVHGFAGLSGDPTMYDGDAPSSLDPSLPLEATIPVLCGALMGAGDAGETPGATANPTTASPAAPGTGTGLAAESGGTNSALIIGGLGLAIALAGGAAGGLTFIRRTDDS